MESNFDRRGGVSRRLTMARKNGSKSRNTRSAASESPFDSFSTIVSREATFMSLQAPVPGIW